MAMDALNNLANNVPNWLTRLDELEGQINKRQTELAAIDLPDKLSETRSLRNKGSQESLKPADDGPSFIPAPEETSNATPEAPLASPMNLSAATPEHSAKSQSTPSSPRANGVLSAQKPGRDVAAAVHSRARAQVKKRTRSTSVLSAEGHTTAYRTRSMIIVYYDSYVQGFFDELVRFISSSRNLLRKAKMAARVAQIKKLAEFDTSAVGEDGEESLPSLRYMSSRRTGPAGAMSRSGFGPQGTKEQPDIYDNLDKGLEAVQCTCEHGAHQFLRDADCNEEIKKIQNKLREVLLTGKEELERVQREEPELAQETSELNKTRIHRPISMRKEFTPSAKEAETPAPAAMKGIGAKLGGPRSSHSKSSFIEPATSTVEVDTEPSIAIDDVNFEYEMPKIQYRSTRAVRYRAGA
jgi:hypothetical protein